ncbi:ATP-grasp domain-containing protein [Paenimyroides ummariense]|nr:ATP-grasp domain-containing protein [Paenimyroides ummariense]
MKFSEKVAILYQAGAAPERNGIIKPMKTGGYADSGADIAYSLTNQEIKVVTPTNQPSADNDFEWVFRDTAEGIQNALNGGATVLWLNTVLYEGHPIEEFISKGIAVVGQNPKFVEIYDDKVAANEFLKRYHLPVPKSTIITKGRIEMDDFNLNFPAVIKPIRGRGSQGVSFVSSKEDLKSAARKKFEANDFGDAVYAEEFLTGEELTVTVMPPGQYILNNICTTKNLYWTLPPVVRFNHENGIAPYSGTVAVMKNSKVISDKRLSDENILKLCSNCEVAAEMVGARAPIRIDCRADKEGNYFLFDLNMKPNMTGGNRPHRKEQDSLTALAARRIGWNFDELIFNILLQNWIN